MKRLMNIVIIALVTTLLGIVLPMGVIALLAWFFGTTVIAIGTSWITIVIWIIVFFAVLDAVTEAI